MTALVTGPGRKTDEPFLSTSVPRGSSTMRSGCPLITVSFLPLALAIFFIAYVLPVPVAPMRMMWFSVA